MFVSWFRPFRRVAGALALAVVAVSLPSVAAAARSATDTTIVQPAAGRIEPPEPCVNDSIRFVVEGCWPCGVDSTLLGERSITLVLSVRPNVDCPTPACPNIRVVKPLGRLAAGPQTAWLRVVVRTLGASGELISRVVHELPTNFTVRPSCGPGGQLPFVNLVRIGDQPAPCDTCPPVVCLGDSIRVHLEGSLPATCVRLVSVDWLPAMSPITPLVARVLVADSTCGFPGRCNPTPVMWSANLAAPPTFLGAPVVTVEVAQQSCAGDSAVVRILGRREFPFTVRECPPVSACLEPMLGVFDDRVGQLPCDVFVGPERVAVAPLSLRTHAPVAALQGRVVQSGGEVLSLQPAGPAHDWSLVTRRATDGSRDLEFVLFAVGDSVIPPGTFPVLTAVTRLDSTTTMGTLAAGIELASDPEGRAIPFCIHVVPEARAVGVCRAAGDTCDANHDGDTDVRDLVLLARCIRHPEQCGVPTASFDCNRDGEYGVSDLLCCARRILRHGGPDTAQVQTADGIAVTFGEPVRGDGTLELPLALEGADRVGAAMLQLAFPGDRYELDGVSFTERSDWLQISDAPGAGTAEIGLVALSDAGPARLPATLRLRLKSGATHGGDVRVASYEVSSPGGARLGGLATGQVALAAGSGPAVVALSAARPNPTGGATRFVVSLPRAADVDLAVHDVAGRRVATLARGRLGAGDTEVTWRAQGVRDGVYFARLIVDGRTYASRITVLRTR